MAERPDIPQKPKRKRPLHEIGREDHSDSSEVSSAEDEDYYITSPIKSSFEYKSDDINEDSPLANPPDSPPLVVRNFDLYQNLLQYPELCIEIFKYLPPDELLQIYSWDRSFHQMMNLQYFSFIKASASINAPHAHVCFQFQCFRQFCIEDPTQRAMKRRTIHNPVRYIPGFKWLSMVTFRHKISGLILRSLDDWGHRLPIAALVVVQKIWFTMAFPSNGARIGLLHNKEYWRDVELYVALLFIIKPDMRFTDPTSGQGEIALRSVFLGQTGLVPLYMLITHQLDVVEVLRFYVAYDYRPSVPSRNLPIFGVPASSIGRTCLEGWEQGTVRALRVDEGILREVLRRSLPVHDWFLDMILYGYHSIPNGACPLPALSHPRKHDQSAFNYPFSGLSMPDDAFFAQMEHALPGINAMFGTVSDPLYTRIDIPYHS